MEAMKSEHSMHASVYVGFARKVAIFPLRKCGQGPHNDTERRAELQQGVMSFHPARLTQALQLTNGNTFQDERVISRCVEKRCDVRRSQPCLQSCERCA